MDSALFHTIIVLVWNLFWLYDRKWEGLKDIYGFSKGPYNDTQKMLTKLVWFYSLSGIFTLFLWIFKIYTT